MSGNTRGEVKETKVRAQRGGGGGVENKRGGEGVVRDGQV